MTAQRPPKAQAYRQLHTEFFHHVVPTPGHRMMPVVASCPKHQTTPLPCSHCAKVAAAVSDRQQRSGK